MFTCSVYRRRDSVLKLGTAQFVLRADDGSLKITLHNPELAQALAAAQIVMDENRDMLQALA